MHVLFSTFSYSNYWVSSMQSSWLSLNGRFLKKSSAKISKSLSTLECSSPAAIYLSFQSRRSGQSVWRIFRTLHQSSMTRVQADVLWVFEPLPTKTTNYSLQSPDEQQEQRHMGVHSSTPAGSMTQMHKYKHKLKMSAYYKTQETKNERFIRILFIFLHSCVMQSDRCLLNKERKKERTPFLNLVGLRKVQRAARVADQQ
jgi:hypothetical protein